MGGDLKRRVVLSGVNFVEAGPLAVFKDALQALTRHGSDDLEIIALVHKRDLYDFPSVRFIDFPDVKGSWLRRLYFEYFGCKKLSRDLDADLWFCMHDITANVTAKLRAVYCHNPAPFYELRWRDVWFDPRFSLFHFLYSVLYGINLDQNDAVVVQQQWVRAEFEQRYSPRRVVVAHPSLERSSDGVLTAMDVSRPVIFFYPAFARCFKNVECLLEATAELSQRSSRPFEIWLTIKGDENRYAKWLYKKFGDLRSVRWIGAVSRESVHDLYTKTDCLVFPSLLETWGLPLSEFSGTGKTILAIDEPYAHETLGDYSSVQFFSSDKPGELSGLMREFLEGSLIYTKPAPPEIAAPFACGWSALFDDLLALPQAGDR